MRCSQTLTIGTCIALNTSFMLIAKVCVGGEGAEVLCSWDKAGEGDVFSALITSWGSLVLMQ